MNRTRRLSFDKTREKIQNIFFSSQSESGKNVGKPPQPSSKKRGGQKNVVAAPAQKNKTTTVEKNAATQKTAGRRGRKPSQQNVIDENVAKRTTAKPSIQYVPKLNARWNTRSQSRDAARADFNAESIESNEPAEEQLDNEQEHEGEDNQLQCIVIMNRLTQEEIKDLTKVCERENDENITSHATESQQQLPVARSESVNDEVNNELEPQAIQETAETAREPIENETNEIHGERTPARSETDDEHLNYIRMAMSSEEDGEDDEMRGFSSNGSQHNSGQNGDSGYNTGKNSALSNVRKWLSKSLSSNSLNDAAVFPDDPIIPEHDIVLNNMLSQMSSKHKTLATEYDRGKDPAFDSQSQISTHFSGTPAKSVDNISVATTHFSDDPELQQEPISQTATPADTHSISILIEEPNVVKAISNTTTHFSEVEQERLSLELERHISFSGVSMNRTISVENVSNVSSAKCSRDEEELETRNEFVDEPNATRYSEREIPHSHAILQVERKRRNNGSVIRAPTGNKELNRRIVSQPTRKSADLNPNDHQHTSQPLAMVPRKRFRPTSQNNSDDDDSLLIHTPNGTEYQESNQGRFITQPTQLTRTNWAFNRNSSLETILGTNSSNVSAIPKYRYNRYQEDQTCFPIAPNTYYTSLVTNEGTTFAVNDFDHGNANIKHHFLSRFNDDLKGLNENFNGYVYATKITANLISHYMNVDYSQIKILEYNKTIIVEDIKVTALELTSWPGATLLAFDTGSNGIILHVGDLRIPVDTEGIEFFFSNRIRKFYFDRSCLMKLYYHIPNDIDRYMGLFDECTKYNQQNITVGLIGLLVLGAFMHGMETLILRLAEMFHMKVFMDRKRREFLDRMLDDLPADDSVHYRLRQKVVDNPRKANIHILDVENINENYLSDYLSNDMNAPFHRILAIRPRGNGTNDVQLVLNKFIKIIDVPNPLVGDYYEYRRFVQCVRENLEQELRARQLQ